MIIVQFIKTPCRRLFFSSRGHARVEKGEINRICAAASMLSFTLAAALEEENLELQAQQREGELVLITADNQQARNCFRVINRGYRLLSQHYPQQVQVLEEI